MALPQVKRSSARKRSDAWPEPQQRWQTAKSMDSQASPLSCPRRCRSCRAPRTRHSTALFEAALGLTDGRAQHDAVSQGGLTTPVYRTSDLCDLGPRACRCLCFASVRPVDASVTGSPTVAGTPFVSVAVTPGRIPNRRNEPWRTTWAGRRMVASQVPACTVRRVLSGPLARP